jgi:hypothetical protein
MIRHHCRHHNAVLQHPVSRHLFLLTYLLTCKLVLKVLKLSFFNVLNIYFHIIGEQRVSTNMVIIKCVNLVFDNNCCAFVFVVPVNLYVVPTVC